MKKRILCYGDSNTWGYDSDNQVDKGRFQVRFSDDVRWTGILAAKLGDGYTVIEEGLNARTTIWDDPAWADRNGLMYLRPCLNAHAPLDLVVLMLGTNDLKMRLCSYVPEIARGASVLVDTILQSCDGRNGKAPEVLLLSPPFIGDSIKSGDRDILDEFGGISVIEKSKQFPEHYRKIADKYDCHFLNAAAYATIGSDALHIDMPGHRRLGEAVSDKIREIFE